MYLQYYIWCHSDAWKINFFTCQEWPSGDEYDAFKQDSITFITGSVCDNKTSTSQETMVDDPIDQAWSPNTHIAAVKYPTFIYTIIYVYHNSLGWC